MSTYTSIGCIAVFVDTIWNIFYRLISIAVFPARSVMVVEIADFTVPEKDERDKCW